MEIQFNLTINKLSDVPQHYKRTIKLIEKCFEYQKGQSFEIDFYPLINQHNLENCYIIHDSKEVIGHVGLQIKNIAQRTPVAFLGGIAIEPEFRGKGLFKTLLEYVISKYTDKVAMFVLWSDKPDLYKKFSFSLAAGQLTSISSKTINEIPNEFKHSKFHELDEQTFTQIKDLYLSTSLNYLTVSRDESDWEKIKKISSCDLFYKTNDEGHIESYFVMNKGRDLQNIIHEIGHIPSVKESFLKKISSFQVWVPEREKNFLSNYQTSYLALFRIANKRFFKKFIEEWSEEQISLNKITSSDIHFTYQEKKFTVDIESFLNYIWGPYPIKEFENVGRPLYFSGLDSI